MLPPFLNVAPTNGGRGKPLPYEHAASDIKKSVREEDTLLFHYSLLLLH